MSGVGRLKTTAWSRSGALCQGQLQLDGAADEAEAAQRAGKRGGGPVLHSRTRGRRQMRRSWRTGAGGGGEVVGTEAARGRDSGAGACSGGETERKREGERRGGVGGFTREGQGAEGGGSKQEV